MSCVRGERPRAAGCCLFRTDITRQGGCHAVPPGELPRDGGFLANAARRDGASSAIPARFLAVADPVDGQTEKIGGQPAQARIQRAVLLVLSGPDSGRQAVLESGKLVIGSAPTAGFALKDRSVSKRHAEVMLSAGHYLVKDLGSTNGSFLNGNRIREAYLNPGDVLTLGTCQLRFEPRVDEVKIPPSVRDRFGPVYGAGPLMRQLFGVLERIAPTETTVLLHGESGTGKDLFARAIHAASARASGPFQVFDCSATVADLIAADLFGHLEGAFTGAQRHRQGAFEAAAGGTLFLDEIGELPLDLQPKLLRALEAREVRPLGGNAAVKTNVRVVAATHRDLFRMVREGTFREDLYYRLAVVKLDIPALRLRREDLPGLIRELAQSIPGRHGPGELTAEALAVLAAQSWPGNVRELRNLLERTMALSDGSTIDAKDLMLANAAAAPGQPELAGHTLEQIERIAIEQTLARTGGHLGRTAQLLGIHRQTLREKIRRYEIHAGDEPEA